MILNEKLISFSTKLSSFIFPRIDNKLNTKLIEQLGAEMQQIFEVARQ